MISTSVAKQEAANVSSLRILVDEKKMRTGAFLAQTNWSHFKCILYTLQGDTVIHINLGLREHALVTYDLFRWQAGSRRVTGSSPCCGSVIGNW